MSIPFKKANILLPKKGTDMTKWTVVACDQYTSEMDYWNDVKEIVGDEPSTLKLTLPEIFLEDDDVDEKIKDINKNMDEYLANNLFDEYEDKILYLERTQADGKVREGIIGMVDLEGYDFSKGSKTPIRATEATIVERIPPRIKVRQNASIELPHIMILIDDDKKEIIEKIKNNISEEDKVYDFDMMKNGGHIKGYILNNCEADRVLEGLENLSNKEEFNKKYNLNNEEVLLFAMGDGNHSLATAKTFYENLKKEIGDKALSHPARYALVEIVNLHSDALEFEAIHRVLFNVNEEDLMNKLNEYYDVSFEETDGQKFEIVSNGNKKSVWIKNPKSNITVGTLQLFLDEYLKNNPDVKIDYIHGEDTVEKLAVNGNMGFILPVMGKDELFKTVILDGALPRKTFSMGHSNDKRFYLEARKIK